MKEITIKCKGFLIPNWPVDVLGFIDFAHDKIKSLCEINNLEFSYSTVCTDFWMYNENSENFASHGVDAGEYHIYAGAISSYFPMEIFKDKKEGETVEFKQLVEVYSNDVDGNRLKGGTIKAEVTFVCTLEQLTSRYSYRGSFEKCYADLEESYKPTKSISK